MPAHSALEWFLFATMVLAALALVTLLLITLHRDRP
jgi:hypothetical protein